MADDGLLKQARSLRKQGKHEQALSALRDALRTGRLAPDQVERAGRFIQRGLRESTPGTAPLRVLVLGQCTTSWLTTALTAVAWGHGTLLRASDGEYDNVLQELMAERGQDDHPDVVVLVPWHQRLLGGGERTAEQRVADELAFWRQAWALATDRLRARVVQVGYDCVVPGALGHHLGAGPQGHVGLVRRVNEALREHLPAGAFLVDLEQVSGTMGRERFYDMRRHFWTKQPFGEAGACRLAEHVAAGIRALVVGPKKVLVVDLDDTLWGGVVGETGPLGIALADSPEGEAYRAFQQHLKDLTRRGCLLAVCSKNNPDDAREPFETNPDMVLSLDDFAAFDASWDPKAIAIQRIAATLRLGLDSFVFFDDNPAEREHIRQALPDIEVVDVPDEPAGFVQALQAGLYFEAVSLTEEDQKRATQYRQEHRRRQAQTAFGSMDDYLSSLDMRAEVGGIDDSNLQRCTQLVGKTNQFNLTTRRHAQEEIGRLCGLAGAVPLTLRVWDRFGDYGLVCVILAVPDPTLGTGALRIDTWLMSCRVIGRTVEEFAFNALVDRARAMGHQRLIGEYLPTRKNAPVNGLYERLGFRRLGESPQGALTYALDLDGARPARTFVAEAPGQP